MPSGGTTKPFLSKVGMSKNDKEKLENTVSIDYLLNFISNRIPKDRNGRIPMTPTRYGDKVIILKSKTGD